jgi:hypothetical protein
MGVGVRQNGAAINAVAAMAPTRRRHGGQDAPAPIGDTLQALADFYAQMAERLLDCLYERPGDLRRIRRLRGHLDWVGARAQMVNSFLKAGDCALSYLCASADAHRRLLPLVNLAAAQLREPARLPVALYLMERIDEELRLT